MYGKALGLIETYGYIGAVEALDACLKAANVELVGCELVRGGLVTVMITGNVSAVKASVDAGAAAACKVSQVLSVDVIARMADGLETIVYKTPLENTSVHTVQANEPTQEKQPTICYEGQEISLADKEVLETIKVVDLRRIARQLEGFPMERNHIKFAKKQELIEVILSYYR